MAQRGLYVHCHQDSSCLCEVWERPVITWHASVTHVWDCSTTVAGQKWSHLWWTSQSMESMLSQSVSTKEKKGLARPWAYREFFEMYFSYTGQSGRRCVESQTLSFSWVNRSSAVAIETTVSFGLLTLASRKHLYASLQICVWRECGSEGRKMWMLKVRCRLRMLC